MKAFIPDNCECVCERCVCVCVRDVCVCGMCVCVCGTCVWMCVWDLCVCVRDVCVGLVCVCLRDVCVWDLCVCVCMNTCAVIFNHHTVVLPYIHRYVLGHDAMRRMGATNVLISGMKGLGIEIGLLTI